MIRNIVQRAEEVECYSPSASLRSSAPLPGSESSVIASEWNECGDPDRNQNGLILIWIASLRSQWRLKKSGLRRNRFADIVPSVIKKNSLRGEFSIFDLLFQKWIDNLRLNFIINISLNRSRTKLRIINLINNFLNFSLAKFW